jgi:hypothetical protein
MFFKIFNYYLSNINRARAKFLFNNKFNSSNIFIYINKEDRYNIKDLGEY